jgi:hypothetical protein
LAGGIPFDNSALLHRRFQIEDLLEQDGHGVTFEALDRESGKAVVLRRYFPFGRDGGGLSPVQAQDYEALYTQLADVRHNGMRSLVAGGCDPQDAMPFLVSELVAGPTLADALRLGPIAAASIVALIDRALEVSALISEALDMQAVWVETAPSAIVVSEDDPQRGFTFWISPLNWLHEADTHPGLSPVLELLRSVMGKPAPGDDLRVLSGLKRWEAWLAANLSASPAEARKTLKPTVLAPAQPPGPQPRPVAAAPQKAAPQPVKAAAAVANVTAAPVKATPTAVKAIPSVPAAPAAMRSPAPGVPATPPVPPAATTQASLSPAARPSPLSRAVAADQEFAKKKSNPFLPILTIVVLLLCAAAVGYRLWQRNEALKVKPAPTDEIDREEYQRTIDRAIYGEGGKK